MNTPAVLPDEKELRALCNTLLNIAPAATPGPYFVDTDPADDAPPHKDAGLALVDTGRSEDWPIARLIEFDQAAWTVACTPETITSICNAYITAANSLRSRLEPTMTGTAAEILKRLPDLSRTDRVSLGWSQTVEDCKILLRLLSEKEEALRVVTGELAEWTRLAQARLRSLELSMEKHGAAEAELAAMKVRLENNERSACGMAGQANIERRRADIAEAELSRVKSERGLTKEQKAEFTKWLFCRFQYSADIARVLPTGERYIAKYEKLADAIIDRLSSQSPAPSAWRAIESAPKDGTHVLLFRDDQGVFEGHFWAAEDDIEAGLDPIWWSVAGSDLSPPDLMPTHWQPLPSPPSQDRSAESGEGK